MSDIERWAPVVGVPGYEVSDLGRVRSVHRVIQRSNGHPQTVRERVLKPRDDGHGYPSVHIGGRSRRIPVLVLEAFVGPRPAGLNCLHADDDQSNNVLDNLSWGTQSDNIKDMVRNGKHHLASRDRCGFGHLLVAENLASDKKRRRCLSCKRARGYAALLRSRGASVDQRALADSYYHEIVRSSPKLAELIGGGLLALPSSEDGAA